MKKLIIALSIVGLALLVVTVVSYAYAFRLASDYEATAKIEPAKVIPMPNADEIESELNAFRAERGLSQLKTDNPILDQAAQARAESMCTANEWSHDKAWEVLDQYYQYDSASENLHYDFLQEGQARNAISGWANSPGHLKAMLADHQEASIGVKFCPGYQGMADAVLVVNYFGNPR